MPTLLITLKGPLQSWAVTEGYAHRGTDDHPSKSGVVGLVASAMGRPRGTDLSDIAGLRFGVRTLRQPGRLTDFQTMGWNREKRKPNPLETKEYLQDCAFLVGLEGDRPMVRMAADAIRHPVFMPYLGRRCCPPAGPIPVTVTSERLELALHGDGPAWVEDPDGDLLRWDFPDGDRLFRSTMYLLDESDPYLDIINEGDDHS